MKTEIIIWIMMTSTIVITMKVWQLVWQLKPIWMYKYTTMLRGLRYNYILSVRHNPIIQSKSKRGSLKTFLTRISGLARRLKVGAECIWTSGCFLTQQIHSRAVNKYCSSLVTNTIGGDWIQEPSAFQQAVASWLIIFEAQSEITILCKTFPQMSVCFLCPYKWTNLLNEL